MLMANLQTWSFHELHFGTARLRHYLDECGENQDLAMQLYEWNTEISAAFWESFTHLEVALRNAIDRQMTVRHITKGRAGHWIFDNARELGRDRGRGSRRHAYPYADIDTAIGRVRKNGMPLDSGQIISEISFGFWHQMVSKSQMFLWPDLVGAFPHMKSRNQALVSAKVESLRSLRNRIGHHHRIWAADLPARFSDLHTLSGYIDPDLETWIEENSRVPTLLTSRPRAT